ncbi:MAG TPA: hypothetical protein VKJ07_04315, partial [Mycobacteriales bacterium]|nr:hypothetical protein [Mycobacteriales bacterium]
ITVDPGDPRHLYAVAGVKTVVDSLFESRDGGTSWRQLNVPRNDAPAAVVVSATGALYVAYGEADETPPPPSGAPQLLMSADDGANWSTVNVPIAAASAWAFGVDPNDGSRGMFAGVAEDSSRGWLLILADTHDGFRTVDSLRTLVLRKPAPSAPCPPYDDCSITVLPDRLGDFYVDVVAGDGSTTADEKVTELLVAVHGPLATLADGAIVAPPPPSASAGTSAGQPPASGTPGTAVPGQLARTCQLPDYVSQTSAAGSPTSSGSLAYDGQSLLYSDPGDDSTQPNTALVRKFDPSTCAPTGVILVQFNPTDLLQVLDPSYPAVEVGEMTYDALRQVLWV